jgi:hypothetical protein
MYDTGVKVLSINYIDNEASFHEQTSDGYAYV